MDQSPVSFTIEDYEYRCARIPVMDQVRLLKKLTSVLGVVAVLRDGEIDGGAAVEMFARAIGGMPDAEFDYVIAECLSRCQRKGASSTGWSNVWSHEGQRPVFDDIGPMEVLEIVYRVLRAALGPFLAGVGKRLSDAGLLRA